MENSRRKIQNQAIPRGEQLLLQEHNIKSCQEENKTLSKNNKVMPRCEDFSKNIKVKLQVGSQAPPTKQIIHNTSFGGS